MHCTAISWQCGIFGSFFNIHAVEPRLYSWETIERDSCTAIFLSSFSFFFLLVLLSWTIDRRTRERKKKRVDWTSFRQIPRLSSYGRSMNGRKREAFNFIVFPLWVGRPFSLADPPPLSLSFSLQKLLMVILFSFTSAPVSCQSHAVEGKRRSRTRSWAKVGTSR